ncbi:MAG: alpha/beta fold hydrolase [Pseudomonadota bacterium]
MEGLDRSRGEEPERVGPEGPASHDAIQPLVRDEGVDAQHAVIAALYDAVIAPERFGALLRAWDSFFTCPSVAEDARVFDPVVAHFDRAAEAVVRSHHPVTDTPQARLDALSCPAAYVSAAGRVLAANAAASDTLGLREGMEVFALEFEPKAETALRKALRSRVPPPSTLLRCTPRDDLETEYLIVDPVRNQDSGALLLLRSVRQLWSAALDDALGDAFALTPAERELMAALFQGESVREYAVRTGRRQATVRTQLSSILSKSGVPNQVELLRMATSVAGLLGERTSAPALRAVRDGVQIHETHHLSDGLTIETVMSGKPDGFPVLFTQTTTAPTLSSAIVDALAKYNIRLISLVKSGAGKTSRKPVSMRHAEWARAYLSLADRLELSCFGVGGQCSGGVYALALTAAALDRVTGCVLVDVGAPLVDVGMIQAMPPSPRRHHLASRFCPMMTLAPINAIATDMRRSPEGAARAVQYFYTDSPVDEAVVAKRPDLHRITIDNLNYAFENARQLVADVSAWSKDTTPFFHAAEAIAPLHFFHGAENRMMDPAAIERFCRERPDRRSARIVAKSGQLVMWEHPEAFAATVAELVPEQ